MSVPTPTWIVTGAAGFIGSCVVRQLIQETGVNVVSYDSLTYAGNLHSLGEALDSPRHRFVKGDIRDAAAVRALIAQVRPAAIMHLAAESHVDRSIDKPAEFVSTNVFGTLVMLEESLAWWRSLAGPAREQFRFHHISTDEVFGSLGPGDPTFEEMTPYAPNSPYSASKAASDHLVRAWHHTYGLPTLITNCSNNYGPYQFPEKLIPVVILNAKEGRPIPVYGDGRNVRDWLYVEDHARALRVVLERGRPGVTYNVGGAAERTNLTVITTLCRLLDEFLPAGAPHERHLAFVTDRPGHDRRYAINFSRLRDELGWQPSETFETGMRRTVRWYLDNAAWLAEVRGGEYRQWMDTNYGDRKAGA